MRTELTEAEIQRYREDGFIVLPEFLEPSELEEWREIVDDAVGARASRKDAKIPGFNVPDADELTEEQRKSVEYYEQVFTQRVNLWQTHEGMRDLMLDPRLGELAADLAGVDGVRIWHDQALIKQPYSNPTGFHLDVPYWSFSSPDALSLWVALDDATLENGCLYYMPGSHKAKKFDNVGIGPEIGAILKVYPEWKDIRPVACPVPAGGAMFHNGLTSHGAGANMTPGLRRAMTCGYMPDGSTFNGQQNILTPDLVARLKVGDVLEDDLQNPLVFSRSKELSPIVKETVARRTSKV